MVVKILDESPIDLENESFVARQSRQSPFGGGFGGCSEYPESLPVHSELTRIPDTETEKQVLAWPVFLYTGAFCTRPGGSGSAGGRRGAGKCRSVSFPVCTVSCGQPRQHRAYPGESPTRSFLPGIHYTRRRIMFLLRS